MKHAYQCKTQVASCKKAAKKHRNLWHGVEYIQKQLFFLELLNTFNNKNAEDSKNMRHMQAQHFVLFRFIVNNIDKWFGLFFSFNNTFALRIDRKKWTTFLWFDKI